MAAAIDYVRANAAKLGADADRICLAAYSAGGPLLTVGLDTKRPHIRCLIAVYAFLDVQQSNLHRENEPAERVKHSWRKQPPCTSTATGCGRAPAGMRNSP